jgi:hypothetical protein
MSRKFKLIPEYQYSSLMDKLQDSKQHVLDSTKPDDVKAILYQELLRRLIAKETLERNKPIPVSIKDFDKLFNQQLQIAEKTKADMEETYKFRPNEDVFYDAPMTHEDFIPQKNEEPIYDPPVQASSINDDQPLENETMSTYEVKAPKRKIEQLRKGVVPTKKFKPWISSKVHQRANKITNKTTGNSKIRQLFKKATALQNKRLSQNPLSFKKKVRKLDPARLQELKMKLRQNPDNFKWPKNKHLRRNFAWVKTNSFY